MPTSPAQEGSKTPKLVMHLDMDAFFAAIEQRDHPEYRGLPVVVGALPGTRGVVSTCSYEARVFGIHSAMPISEAYRRCPDAVFLRPDMARYQSVSQSVMAILSSISPVVEPVSVDEAYLDIAGLERLFGPPEEIGRLAQERIRSQLGLSASVGIGPNRLIAKLASDFKKPGGLTVVSAQDVLEFLDPMPVGKLSGVGKVLEKRFHGLGISTIGDLRRLGLTELQKHFGERSALSLYDRSQGIASDQVGVMEPRKSISREVTFETDTSDQTRLHDTLLELACDVGRMARGEKILGRVVTLKIRLKGFETHTRQRRLNYVTCSDREIFREGWELYQSSGYAGRSVRLIGVGLSELEQTICDADLFSNDEKASREKRLFEVVDRINARHGKLFIRLGRSSHDSEP